MIPVAPIEAVGPVQVAMRETGVRWFQSLITGRVYPVVPLKVATYAASSKFREVRVIPIEEVAS